MKIITLKSSAIVANGIRFIWLDGTNIRVKWKWEKESFGLVLFG